MLTSDIVRVHVYTAIRMPGVWARRVLGVPPVACALFWLHPVLAASVVAAKWWTGVGPRWVTDVPTGLVLVAAAAVAFRIHARTAAAPDGWRWPDSLIAFVLVALLARLCMALQYGVIAFGRPLVDDALAAADAQMGVNVAALTAWTSGHAWVKVPLRWAYLSMLPQLAVPLIVLPLYRDREALWEYVFHFHVCLMLTVIGVAVWPAVGVHWRFGFTPLVDQHRVVEHVLAVRTGALRHFNMWTMDGLVSFPSFHAASALFMTWAYRRHRSWLVPAGVVNLMLIAATVMLGLHYAADVVGSVVVVGASLVAYRWWRVATLTS